MAALSPDSHLNGVIQLPPNTAINHALGANHDLNTGLDELVDNAIDAGAKTVAIVLHVDGHRLEQISIHDDGRGMSREKISEVLRLGGHSAQSAANIGRYGMGLKEGSFANSDHPTILSRRRGDYAHGYQLSKDSFTAGVLNERAVTKAWNLRHGLVTSSHGTTILWTGLINVYMGSDSEQGERFISQQLEKLRKHLGIRYHRFLETERLSVNIHISWDGASPSSTPAIRPIDPFGYNKSGHRGYPRMLTQDGTPDAPGISAHIWTNRSETDAFNLEAKDELGHQGFYIYDADRLITQGGWSGVREPRKQLKLLRIGVSDPRVIDRYITISPQKGSVRFSEEFHRFLDSLKSPEDPSVTLETVFGDAAATLKESNRRSSKPHPLAEAGRGLDPSIRAVVEYEAVLKPAEPIDVFWGKTRDDDFVAVFREENRIVINDRYRSLFNNGATGLNDAPVLKALLYLLFNDIVSSGRRTGRAEATTELWISILNAAAAQQELRTKK